MDAVQLFVDFATDLDITSFRYIDYLSTTEKLASLGIEIG
jgi:hypothetical protein